MTFHLEMRRCPRCKNDTVHEDTGEGAQCAACLERDRKSHIGKFINEPGMDLKRVQAALDGPTRQGSNRPWQQK